MPRGGSRPGAGRKKKAAVGAPENRAVTASGGRFKPGQSGNPGGRPKVAEEVKTLARQYTPEAIGRLAEWMRSDNAKASVSACSALLDRGWGRPSQELTGKDGEALIPRRVVIEIDDAVPAKGRQ